MLRKVLPFADGTYSHKFSEVAVDCHVLAFSVESGTMTGGTVTVTARAPGSSVFETILDGVVDLSSPNTVVFTFAVAEYKFVLSGLTGTATELVVTDTTSEV